MLITALRTILLDARENRYYQRAEKLGVKEIGSVRGLRSVRSLDFGYPILPVQRSPNTYLKGCSCRTSGLKIGAPQKRDIQAGRIQPPPPLGPLNSTVTN